MGLTAARRAEEELAESEVAKGGSLIAEPVHGLMRTTPTTRETHKNKQTKKHTSRNRSQIKRPLNTSLMHRTGLCKE